MIITLRRPLAPHEGTVSQWFGDHPDCYSVWDMAGHNGLDYAVPQGSHVLAAHDGICSVAMDPPGYGQYIIVEGPDYRTIYAHLRAVRVVSGQKVAAGERIGDSGNTGNSTGPHLHFGLKIHDMRNPAYRDWIDPAPFRDV